jgi:hypothetical protein
LAFKILLPSYHTGYSFNISYAGSKKEGRERVREEGREKGRRRGSEGQEREGRRRGMKGEDERKEGKGRRNKGVSKGRWNERRKSAVTLVSAQFLHLASSLPKRLQVTQGDSKGNFISLNGLKY